VRFNSSKSLISDNFNRLLKDY